jgi:hypothetical protein
MRDVLHERRMRLTAAIVLACASSVAYADEPPVPPEPAPPEPAPPQPAAAPAPAAEPGPTTADLQDRLDAMQRQQEAQQREIEQLKSNEKERNWLLSLVSLYVDVGAFAVGGDGSGIRSDIANIHYPKYAGSTPGQWVFEGDPRSTAINALGEPADTSDSRELTDDTIHSGGHPTVLVNSIGLAISKSFNEQGIYVTAFTELLPRASRDILDVELANIKYRPSHELNLVFEVGKIDSVLGVEYRTQDAPNRLTVTPSLIARYTTGRPYGISARLTRGQLVLSGAITDGNMMDHRFDREHSLHSTWVPNAAGHVQYKIPGGLKVGISGTAGPQDDQSSTSIAQWHLGADVSLLDFHGWDFVAEYVQGIQQGQTKLTPCDVAACLDYKGAYVLVDRQVQPWITPYIRVDWRDAVHKNEPNFVYESHVVRATIGAHFEMTSRILAKIEYTFNHELDGIPQFADDIVTSSLVVATD